MSPIAMLQNYLVVGAILLLIVYRMAIGGGRART